MALWRDRSVYWSAGRWRPEVLLSLRNVDKVFGLPGSPGGVVQALQNLSLDVGEGEFVSVVGPSGCGKSTLIRLVSGLEKPSGGQIVFAGDEVRNPLPAMGMAFQQPTLLPWRTVLQNVLLPFELMGIGGREQTQKARDLLATVGLSEFEHRYPEQLSGGMQHRVAICRSLVTDPKILILDEPFAALDLLTREELAIELARICQLRKVTTLFVTHSITEAVFLSDRVVVMSPRPGQIVRILSIGVARPRTATFEEYPTMISNVKEIKDLIYSRRISTK